MKKTLFLMAIIVAMGGLPPAEAAVLTFNATITSAGTCAMAFTPGSPLTLPPTNVAALIGNTTNAVVSVTPMTVTFTGCPKLAPITTPTLKITGTTITDSTMAADRPYLFKSSGESSGFGVVLANKAQPTFTASDLYKKDQEVKLGAAGFIIPDENKYDFWWGLSCGGSDSCQPTNLQSGSLMATLNFEFMYK